MDITFVRELQLGWLDQAPDESSLEFCLLLKILNYFCCCFIKGHLICYTCKNVTKIDLFFYLLTSIFLHCQKKGWDEIFYVQQEYIYFFPLQLSAWQHKLFLSKVCSCNSAGWPEGLFLFYSLSHQVVHRVQYFLWILDWNKKKKSV